MPLLHSKRRTASRAVLLAIVAPLASAGAQIGGNGSHGAFRPTADVTLDTTPNGGVFLFTSIAIPIGVTVRLRGLQGFNGPFTATGRPRLTNGVQEAIGR